MYWLFSSALDNAPHLKRIAKDVIGMRRILMGLNHVDRRFGSFLDTVLKECCILTNRKLLKIRLERDRVQTQANMFGLEFRESSART